jgi:putative two-component system response regulator
MNDVMDKTPDANILIVDDQPENVRLLEMMLSYAGYANVQSTTDPRQVKGLYQDNDFDIILLDIRMPHLDGFRVMEQLSDGIKGDYLPVLVLTAQKDMETRIKALEAGARDFVTKPFDKTEVLNRISNMCTAPGFPDTSLSCGGSD